MTTRDFTRSAALALALLGLALGLAVHAATYFGLDPRDLSPGLWWGLHLTSVPALVAGTLYYSRRPMPEQAAATGADRLDLVLVTALGLFAAYAAFNFMFTLIVLNDDASPRVVDGRRVLYTHGAVVRELDEGEFVRHKVYEARAHSGHWALCYTVAVAALLEPATRRPRRRSRVAP